MRPEDLAAAAEGFLREVARRGRRTFATDDLEARVRQILGPEGYLEAGEYGALARWVAGRVEAGDLSPIRTRGRNGRRPPLFRAYRLTALPGARPESLPPLHPRIDPAGARRLGPGLRAAVEAVSAYLFAHPDPAARPRAPRNERSLEIFGDEKFLERRPGFLRTLGLDLADVHALDVREPFFHRRFGEGPAALAVENLSAFWSVCRVVEEGRWAWGEAPGLVVYGEGKKILRSIEFLEAFPEIGRVGYFGDLDPEGVRILAALRTREPRCRPEERLYRALLGQRHLARPLKERPAAADPQGAFAGCGDLADRVAELFAAGLWLPQEALGYEVLRAGPEGG